MEVHQFGAVGPSLVVGLRIWRSGELGGRARHNRLEDDGGSPAS